VLHGRRDASRGVTHLPAGLPGGLITLTHAEIGLTAVSTTLQLCTLVRTEEHNKVQSAQTICHIIFPVYCTTRLYRSVSPSATENICQSSSKSICTVTDIVITTVFSTLLIHTKSILLHMGTRVRDDNIGNVIYHISYTNT